MIEENAAYFRLIRLCCIMKRGGSVVLRARATWIIHLNALDSEQRLNNIDMAVIACLVERGPGVDQWGKDV